MKHFYIENHKKYLLPKLGSLHKHKHDENSYYNGVIVGFGMADHFAVMIKPHHTSTAENSNIIWPIKVLPFIEWWEPLSV